MNKLFKVFIIVISFIIMLLSFAFIAIEARLIFSLDWLAYDSPIMGLIRYLCRLLIALFAFVKSLLEMININKKNKVKEYLYYCDFAYVIIAIFVVIYSANYIGIICVSLALINLKIVFKEKTVTNSKIMYKKNKYGSKLASP